MTKKEFINAYVRRESELEPYKSTGKIERKAEMLWNQIKKMNDLGFRVMFIDFRPSWTTETSMKALTGEGVDIYREAGSLFNIKPTRTRIAVVLDGLFMTALIKERMEKSYKENEELNEYFEAPMPGIKQEDIIRAAEFALKQYKERFEEVSNRLAKKDLDEKIGCLEWTLEEIYYWKNEASKGDSDKEENLAESLEYQETLEALTEAIIGQY